jgi:Flp pilus assembly protein TadG
VVLVYSIIIFSVLIGFCSLGVDLAHVQVAKQELETAVVAAVRYGAAGLQSDAATATANAMTVAAQNKADGSPVVLLASDIQFGNWNTSTRTFTVVTGAAENTANAIRITTGRTVARGNGVSLSFAQLLGQSFCDITATSTAMITRGNEVTATVPATSSPFLAGEPNGTESSPNNPHNSPDFAPAESPVNFSGLNITPGHTITFDSINGGAGNTPGGATYGADGNPNDIETNTAGDEHGIATITGPLNAVIGVFLSNSLPDDSPAPASLDFSNDAERDFNSLSPLVQQVFFIGDGRTDTGVLQTFVIPTGATRLFVGTWDGYQWNNNFGQYIITAHNSPTITLVQ